MNGRDEDGDDRVERTHISPAPARRGYLEPGTQLSGMFQIDAPIARGGMGEVYRGHNIHTGDVVAIKVIKADFAESESALDLFKREARALDKLNHDAIVRYYVFTIEPTLHRPFLAMEFVDGVSLSDALRSGPMAVDDVLALARRIGGGLHVAHARQIIHRDVSPDNIIMPGGDVRAAKIIDFGIARGGALGAGTIVGSGVAGKYGYMSPEQANGTDVGPKSDIYSFGLVLAEAARGRQLDMGGSLADVVRKRMSVPDLGDIDESLRPLIAAMLAPDPADRPASMQEVAEWTPGAAIGSIPAAAPQRGGFLFGGAKAPAKTAAKTAEKTKTGVKPRPSGATKPPGQTAARSTMAPAQRASKAPGAATTPPEAPARGFPVALAGIAVALAAAASAGAYFAFFSGPPRPPGPDAPRVEPAAPPKLQPPPAPKLEPEAKPEQKPEAKPESKPETKPEQKPEPESKPAPPQPDAGVSAPPPAPPLATPPNASFPAPSEDLTPVPGARIEEMAAFVRDWRGGDCVVARALALNAASAQLEGVAQTAEPLGALNDAFRAKFGFEPEIGGWLIARSQCAVTQFLARARLDPAAAPRLELGSANLRSGQHLTGVVEPPPGREIEVWQIADSGEAHNITALMRSSARAFNLRIERVGGGAGPKPQIIMAFASAQPLKALKLDRPVPADKALPAVLAESQARNLPLGVALRVFNVE